MEYSYEELLTDIPMCVFLPLLQMNVCVCLFAASAAQLWICWVNAFRFCHPPSSANKSNDTRPRKLPLMDRCIWTKTKYPNKNNEPQQWTINSRFKCPNKWQKQKIVWDFFGVNWEVRMRIDITWHSGAKGSAYFISTT